jgi:hypothetical protein
MNGSEPRAASLAIGRAIDFAVAFLLIYLCL